MANNRGHALCYSDEDEFFGHITGRYSADASINNYLKASHGSRVIRCKRRMKGQSFEVMRANLTLCQTVQPAVALRAWNYRGGWLVERGLFARFLVVLAKPRAGTRDTAERLPNWEKRRRWNRFLSYCYLKEPRMTNNPLADHSVMGTDARIEERHFVRLSPAAHVEFRRISATAESRRVESGDLGRDGIAPWGARYETFLMRIACILHYAKCFDAGVEPAA